jgi:hypothetical protein
MLRLESTQVTDALLDELKGFTSLQWLELIGTKVTDAGVKKLRQTLEYCRIGHLTVPKPRP